MLKIGIVGLGMVGGALVDYFKKKENYKLFIYDKYKEVGSIEEVNEADYIYICVPTPYENGCNTNILEEVINQIKDEKAIIIKSTVIPGTTEHLQKKYPQHNFLFNPEFLTEMTADQDMSYPDRQIVGYTERSYTIAKEVLLQLPLAPFERIVPATDAEMIKYAGNAWFSVKVAFVNQIYDLCEKKGIDYKTVLEGMSADKRIGRTHLKVMHKGYRGYGGKCLPKDIKALIHFAKQAGISIPTLESVDDYNDKLVKNQGLNPLDTDAGKTESKAADEKSYINSKEIRQ